MYLIHESSVSEVFAILSILFNVISSPCFAQPLDSNASIINATNSDVNGMCNLYNSEVKCMCKNFLSADYWIYCRITRFNVLNLQSQQARNQIFRTDVDFLPVIVFLSNCFPKIHYVTLSWLRRKKNKNQKEVCEPCWLPYFIIA